MRKPRREYLRDLEKIVADTSTKTEALIVLTSPYWVPQFDPQMHSSLRVTHDFGPARFNKIGRNPARSYAVGTKEIADSHGCVFVDLFKVTEGATWLLNDDLIHYSDVGQRVIGQLIFNKIAAKCSFIGKKSIRQAREGKFNIANTGDTNAMSKRIEIWHERINESLNPHLDDRK